MRWTPPTNEAPSLETTDDSRRAIGSAGRATSAGVAEAHPDFRRQWQTLVSESTNFYAQYQSPEWFDHLVATGVATPSELITVFDPRSNLVGVTPFGVREHPLNFLAKGRDIGRFSLRAIMLTGGTPLAIPDADVHDRIYEQLAATDPSANCIYLHSVQVGSFAWNHLQSSEYVRRNFLPYLPRGIAPFHSLRVPDTFETYLKQFHAKKRYNLNRQLRLLREAQGELRCERIDSPEQIPLLVSAAEAVLPRSWQRSLTSPGLYEVLGSPERLVDLTRRGLLRSYVLICGSTPRALVLGYQYNGIYHYAEIAYDESVASFSPGSSLLFLLIKDVIEHDRPRFVNLGIGHAEYKRIFGNTCTQDASVILFRKTPANFLRRFAHKGFSAAVRVFKARSAAAASSPTATPEKP